MKKKKYNEGLQDLALLMSVNCVRNTIIEDYHSGTFPSSKTGDYSDVKVVTPFGDIPWIDVARIDDKEMKEFNIEVVNKIYTFLQFILNSYYSEEDRQKFIRLMSFFYPNDWNDPQIDEDMLKGLGKLKQ